MCLVGVVVRRYIDFLIIIITYPYSSCICSFFAAASLLFVHFLILVMSTKLFHVCGEFVHCIAVYHLLISNKF